MNIIEACSNGHTHVISLLLKDSRIDINKEDNNGMTGFVYACFYGQSEIVRLLLQDSRVDVNKGNNDGWTVFMFACFNGHTEIVTLLLQDSRIDVNKGDEYGKTGFMYACFNGYGGTVSMLSESSRVDCVCGWKESVDRLCRRVSENVMRDDHAQWSLSEMWKNLNRIGMGVFIRGWFGKNERMKEVWIYGDRERREENKRSSEMVCKRETEWRRVSDYFLEEDITSVLLLCHYAESIQRALKRIYSPNMRNKVFEMVNI